MSSVQYTRRGVALAACKEVHGPLSALYPHIQQTVDEANSTLDEAIAAIHVEAIMQAQCCGKVRTFCSNLLRNEKANRGRGPTRPCQREHDAIGIASMKSKEGGNLQC